MRPQFGLRDVTDIPYGKDLVERAVRGVDLEGRLDKHAVVRVKDRGVERPQQRRLRFVAERNE